MPRTNTNRKELGDKRLTWKQIADEATVDCYNEYEVFTGWEAYLESKISFPSSCRVDRKQGTLLGFDTTKSGLALLAVVKIDGNQYKLDAATVTILDKRGSRYLEAYKKWL